jgi:glycerophosphoryl diester phosphodiesterase
MVYQPAVLFKLVSDSVPCIGHVFFFLPGRYQEVKLILTNAANQTLVMAHRGDSVDAPENTLPAFQAAIDHGADAAEMDVQMTKDGTIVVLHDSSIDRTSTGSGNIWDVTYDEIKDLDNGSFFSPEFADTRIPTLDQVIKLCKGKLYLNIEIKRTGHDEGIEQKVLDIIKDNHFQDQCDITSMDYDTLVNVRRLDSTVKTVYTTTVAVGNVSDLSAADAFSVETTFVTQSFVRSMRQNGKQLFVWTVNNEDEMERMIQLGVNAIITNDPVSCRAIVTEAQDAGVFGILSRLRTGVLGS